MTKRNELVKRGAFGEVVWAVGHDAIAIADRLSAVDAGFTLGKFEDPEFEAQESISLQLAREIAREDAALIYLVLDYDAYGLIAALDSGATYAERRESVATDDAVEAMFADVLTPAHVVAMANPDHYGVAIESLRRGYASQAI